MLEIAITGLVVAVTVGMLLQRGHGVAVSAPLQGPLPHDDDGTDLPCPWCRSQTREDDVSCPSCGQPFG